MVPPFHRRESSWYALGVAVALALMAAANVAAYGWSAAALAAGVAFCVVLLLFAAITWRLPADMAMRPMPGGERANACAPPPPDTARLRVVLRREPLALYRMDVLLDRVMVGQLRPGTGLVVPIAPGPHELSARVWLRSVRFREAINALRGTDADFIISASGSRGRQYGIERSGVDAALRDARTVVMAPCRGSDLSR